MDDRYRVKLPVFEGPLDLLLSLIREHKIDIYDIPISLITHQFLQYIEMRKALNLETAGEFLVMASTLINIKSKMLLPIEEQEDEEMEEDPRTELVQKLLEYQSYKEAALSLKEREEEWESIFFRKPTWIDNKEISLSENFYLEYNMYDLMIAFRKILEKARLPEHVMRINKEILTIKDRISIITERLDEESIIKFNNLFDNEKSKIELIVTFLALLEMVKIGLAKAYQKQDFDNIWIIHPDKELRTEVRGQNSEDRRQRSEV